jgi:D-glycero-alpha-D-manno-heptose 1-phosphate guanylyltransferase
LVGGLGTRSRSVFLSGPKSMAPVANRPFLEYLLAKLRVDGIRHVVLCVGYRRSEVQGHFHKGTKWGLELHYSIEEELVGNAGAVKKAARLLEAPALFVFNGDSLVGLDVQAMWNFHHARRALATVALVASNRTSRYPRVLMDENGTVTAFRNEETNCGGSGNGNGLVNAGAYLLSRQFIDSIPDDRLVSMEDEMLPTLIGSGLYGFVTNGVFLDIGVPDDLARAQHELPMRWKV